ncbi:MAG: hypothetical protein ACI9KE_005266, partial [Polyangiales bacterium]
RPETGHRRLCSYLFARSAKTLLFAFRRAESLFVLLTSLFATLWSGVRLSTAEVDTAGFQSISGSYGASDAPKGDHEKDKTAHQNRHAHKPLVAKAEPATSNRRSCQKRDRDHPTSTFLAGELCSLFCGGLRSAVRGLLFSLAQLFLF